MGGQLLTLPISTGSYSSQGETLGTLAPFVVYIWWHVKDVRAFSRMHQSPAIGRCGKPGHSPVVTSDCDDCHGLRVKGSQTLHVGVLCPKENWISELEGSLWSPPRSFTDEETHVAAPWGPQGGLQATRSSASFLHFPVTRVVLWCRNSPVTLGRPLADFSEPCL